MAVKVAFSINNSLGSSIKNSWDVISQSLASLTTTLYEPGYKFEISSFVEKDWLSLVHA